MKNKYYLRELRQINASIYSKISVVSISQGLLNIQNDASCQISQSNGVKYTVLTRDCPHSHTKKGLSKKKKKSDKPLLRFLQACLVSNTSCEGFYNFFCPIQVVLRGFTLFFTFSLSFLINLHFAFFKYNKVTTHWICLRTEIQGYLYFDCIQLTQVLKYYFVRNNNLLLL